MIFNNYGFFRRLILVIAGMGLKGWKDYTLDKNKNYVYLEKLSKQTGGNK